MAKKTEQITSRNQRIIYQVFELLSDQGILAVSFFFAFVVACFDPV